MRKTVVGDLTLLVQHYYVPPRGCTEGDYWTTGSPPTYEIACPACGYRTRYSAGLAPEAYELVVRARDLDAFNAVENEHRPTS